jgi:hypothetical protein
MRKLAGVLTAVMVAAMPAMALADAAGSALGVDPAANATLNNENRTLVVGSDIFIGDLVKTGPKGQVQILFADNTELVVGPSSALTIEDYLIRNDGSAGKLAVDMLSGAFRFATGDSAKNRYVIGTPTGTIGVRGTEFDVHVARPNEPNPGATWIMLYGGAVQFCTFDKVCEVIDDFCEVGHMTTADSEVIGDSRETKGELRKQLKADFIYAMSQSSLLREFWFRQARDCLNREPNSAPDPLFPDDTDPGPADPNSPNNPKPPTTPPPTTPPITIN